MSDDWACVNEAKVDEIKVKDSCYGYVVEPNSFDDLEKLLPTNAEGLQDTLQEV